MKNPLFTPSAALLLSVCALYWAATLQNPAPSPTVELDLRDAVNGRVFEKDLAAAHAGIAGTENEGCRLCHMRVRRNGTRPLWADPAAWIASNAPAAAIDEPNMRDSGICLSCHDGVNAGGRDGHPVGIDYAAAARRNPGALRDPASAPNLRLDAGKIACVSCHSAHRRDDAAARAPACSDCHLGY